MGKIVGTAPSIIQGSVGLYTYRQTKDGTVVSEKVKARGISNRTLKQCMVQFQLANLHHLFNAFAGAIDGAFENIPQNQSTRNAFIKANYGGMPIYLTKQASNFGAAVAVGVQVSRGSLASITVTKASTPYTNIDLGGLVIDANTTIAAFSQAVIDHNPGYLNGDQLSYLSVIQGTRAFGDLGGIPVVTCNRYEITLDIHDSVHKLWDFVARYGFSSVANGDTQRLGCSGTPVVGAYTWLHSRGFGDEMRVSTQFLEDNNADVISAWSGAEALEKAAQSYGGYKGARFLEPGQTSSSVNVDEGNDTTTGAVFGGAFAVAAGAVTATNANAQRVQLPAGEAVISLDGTNMTAFDQSVKLRMYASSNSTTPVEVTATKDASASTSAKAVYKATVASPNLWLGALLVNNAAVKTFNAFGGGTTGGGDVIEG